MLQQILSNAFSLGLSIMILVAVRFALVYLWAAVCTFARKYDRAPYTYKWAIVLTEMCKAIRSFVRLITLKDKY